LIPQGSVLLLPTTKFSSQNFQSLIIAENPQRQSQFGSPDTALIIESVSQQTT
ncbi:MAG: hypothetical protein EZS28_019830, partial [Streblomastix strix]